MLLLICAAGAGPADAPASPEPPPSRHPRHGAGGQASLQPASRTPSPGSSLPASELRATSPGSTFPILGIFEFTQVHMGLPVRIVLHAADEQTARRAAAAAFDRIATLDRMMSDYRPDSDVRRIALRAGEAVPVSRELLTVVQQAVEIARLTDGAFDPTIAPLAGLWRDARRTGRLPDPSALAVAKSKVAWHRIELNPAMSTIRLPVPGMALDLGGIAKGYILQEALRTLRLLGVTRVLIESGGDIVAGDAPPGRPGWSIDAAGADDAFTQRAARLTNVAIASSGASAQFLELEGVRYSHVIDPRTGLGVTRTRTARVIARDAATADALATALTVLESSAAGVVISRFPGVMVSVVEESTRELPDLPELPELPKVPEFAKTTRIAKIARIAPGLPQWPGNPDARRKSVDSGNFDNPGTFSNFGNLANFANLRPSL